MTIDEIKQIPKDRTVTYARIVVDYCPQKDDPNRVRITVGGNLIDYPDELTTQTADLVTSKILRNSVLSTPNAKDACADIGDMYLQTPMDCYEYMRTKANLVPDEYKDLYKLHDKVYSGFIYMEIRRGCYRLPQAGILANKLPKKRLAKHGYFEVPHTPGLFKHISSSRPVQFTLVLDDFGIKYVEEDHLQHLLNAIEQDYSISVDRTVGLYCGITLKWDYKHRYLDISMPGYVEKQLIKYNHPKPKKPQHCPREANPTKYGSKTQEALPVDDSPTIHEKGPKLIQQIVSSFLYYCRATDPTIPHALSELSSQQLKLSENSMKRCRQFMDYMLTHSDANIHYYTLDMILNVHSDASYLSCADAKSRAAGIFFPRFRPPRQTTHQTQLCNPRPLHHPQIRQRFIFECKRSQGNAAHLRRAGPSTASHTHPH